MEALAEGLSKETTRHPPSRRYLKPQDGDEVEVRFSLSVAGRQVDSTGEGTRSFKLGQQEVLDLAVRHLFKGEHADFTVASHLLGGEGDGLLRVELVTCPLREDLFEDGGAVKTLVLSTEGRPPRPGDECQVSYSVTSAEGVLTSARAAVYKIGGTELGQLAKVMDKALLSMKLKEEATVRCRPAYVADSTQFAEAISISLTLEEIFQVHDVSLGVLDGTVLRKRIKEGSGSEKLHDTGRVTLRVLAVMSNGEKVAQDLDLTFVAGDGQACDALEGAVLGLREGDEAMLRVLEPQACEGLLDVPLEAPVMVHFRVLKVQKVPEKWDLTTPERLERCRQRKAHTNRLFSSRPRLAARHYQEIAAFLARAEEFQEGQREALELRRVARLNEAACMLQLNQMQQVKELCDRVLQEDPEQPKALFRRGKALMALQDYQAALEDLQRLRHLEPSAAGTKLLREAKEELRKQDRLSSNTFSKMCAGLGGLPEPTPTVDPLVTAPDLEEEYAKLARDTGVPLHRLKPAVDA